MSVKDRMTRLLAAPAPEGMDPQSLQELSAASTPDLSLVSGRLRAAMESLLTAGSAVDLPGGLGMALPHLLPLLMRRLEGYSEENLGDALRGLARILVRIADGDELDGPFGLLPPPAGVGVVLDTDNPELVAAAVEAIAAGVAGAGEADVSRETSSDAEPDA